MKNALLIFAVLALASCNKEVTDKCARVTTAAPADEVTTLQAYISSKGITAVADERGFYYTIVRPGTGTQPTVCSTVTVSYTGRLTNGQQFDASPGVTFLLNNLIIGWKEGIPMIAPGGSIILYLPPSLAYGATAQSGIPANSILVFSIDLIKSE